jgi:hypothetical protein
LPQENAFSAGDGRIRNKIYMVRYVLPSVWQRLYFSLPHTNAFSFFDIWKPHHSNHSTN